MGFQEYGSQKTDTPKTPTLRQWCKQNEDSDIHASQVKVIFKPGTYASYTFVTEANFKVVVERHTVLENYLNTSLESALGEGACIYIQIKDRAKGSWSLSALEGSQTEWDDHAWGWKAGETTAKKPDSKKNRSTSNKSGTPEVK